MAFGRLIVTSYVMLALVACGVGKPAEPPRSGASGASLRLTPGAAGRAQSKSPDVDSDGIPEEQDMLPASPSAEQAAKAPPPPPPGEKKPEPAKDAPRAEGNEAAHDTSMLIYTARVTMAVYQVEQGLAAVEKIAKDMGGYLSSKHDREITVRVPRNRFEPTLAAVDKIGDVLHRDIQAQDVTDEFVDTEIRIKNARAMQIRLKALLEKAPVKEALEIEKEMRRVTEEIELLEGKLKLLKDKIAYSTVTVAFEPRGSTIQATRIKLPFAWLTSLGLPTLLQLSEER